MVVPDLPEAAVEFDYQVVPVHPVTPTNMTVRFYNNGNAPIGYDLFLEAPSGWQAGFTNLGSEAGALSGSTGLINSEAHRAVGLVFTPPQVMTAAGAERVVKLTAVSQTEQQELTLFEIPIRVMTVRELSIDLETSLGTLRPDSSVTLRYSLEHKGNVDFNFTPSFELPSGWSTTSSLETVELPWATSRNLLYSLEAGKNARSGTIKLHLDNGSNRFTWEGTLNVEILPEPTLTFVGLELQDGTAFGTPQGAGSHPSGESLKFTWLLGNNAETVWNPSASLQLDPGLFGECNPVEPVAMGDVSPVVCNVLIAANMAPMSEPSFTVVLSDSGVERTTTVGLLVAPNEAVSWDIGSVPALTTGEERQVTVEITNTGNTAVQRQVVVEAPAKWEASVDGNDILDLAVGQSALVRLNVRADTPGSESITVNLVQSTASEPAFSFSMTSTGEPIGTSSESGLDSGFAVVLLISILLLVLVPVGMTGLRGRAGAKAQQPVVAVPAPTHAPAQGPQPVLPVAVKPAQSTAAVAPPMCWACRQPITTAMVGCPACGARYHADATAGCTAASLESCANCGGSANNFVNA